MLNPVLVSLFTLVTTTLSAPKPDFPRPGPFAPQSVDGFDLAEGTERFPDLQATLKHTVAQIGSDGSSINYLDPSIPTASGRGSNRLDWLPHLRGISWNPHNVPNAANITDPVDKQAYVIVLEDCLAQYGRDPFLQSWQGKHCDTVKLPKSGEEISIGMFRSQTTGEYKNPSNCYEACSGWVKEAIDNGVTDFVCYDFESRVRVGNRGDGLAVLSRDTECQLGFHREIGGPAPTISNAAAAEIGDLLNSK